MSVLQGLICDQEFSSGNPLPRFWNCNVLQFCTLEGLVIYDSPEGIYADCTFKNTLFYWTLWNCASITNSAFTGCTFQGSSFSGTSVVKTVFSNCKFALDNLGGQCSFTDSIFALCEFKDCEFIARKQAECSMFENSRFYGCKMENCTGLDSFP